MVTCSPVLEDVRWANQQTPLLAVSNALGAHQDPRAFELSIQDLYFPLNYYLKDKSFTSPVLYSYLF